MVIVILLCFLISNQVASFVLTTETSLGLLIEDTPVKIYDKISDINLFLEIDIESTITDLSDTLTTVRGISDKSFIQGILKLLPLSLPIKAELDKVDEVLADITEMLNKMDKPPKDTKSVACTIKTTMLRESHIDKISSISEVITAIRQIEVEYTIPETNEFEEDKFLEGSGYSITMTGLNTFKDFLTDVRTRCEEFLQFLHSTENKNKNNFMFQTLYTAKPDTCQDFGSEVLDYYIENCGKTRRTTSQGKVQCLGKIRSLAEGQIYTKMKSVVYNNRKLKGQFYFNTKTSRLENFDCEKGLCFLNQLPESRKCITNLNLHNEAVYSTCPFELSFEEFAVVPEGVLLFNTTQETLDRVAGILNEKTILLEDLPILFNFKGKITLTNELNQELIITRNEESKIRYAKEQKTKVQAVRDATLDVMVTDFFTLLWRTLNNQPQMVAILIINLVTFLTTFLITYGCMYYCNKKQRKNYRKERLNQAEQLLLTNNGRRSTSGERRGR